MADVLDFNFNGYTLVFDLPGDDRLRDMIRDAERNDHFVRAETCEMGADGRRQGVWFRFTVQFDNEAAAAWYNLKWS